MIKNYLLTVLFLSFFVMANSQTIIQMQKRGGVFVMPCKVNGLTLNFIFDTGASDVSVSLTEALFMLKNGYLSESDLIGTEYYKLADGNIAEGTKINLKVIEIGRLKLTNVKASIVHNLSAPLLLGQSALSKLGKIEFDYSQNTLKISNGTVDQASFQNERNANNALYAKGNKLQIKLRTFLYSKNDGTGRPIVRLKKGNYVDVLDIDPKNDYIKVRFNRYTGYVTRYAFYQN